MGINLWEWKICTLNYKAFLKEIREVLNKWKHAVLIRFNIEIMCFSKQSTESL
jgi:hypothetical protein